MESTKKCPHCAETIQADARVSRYCSRDLETAPAPRHLDRKVTKDKSAGGAAFGSIICMAAGWWWFFGGGSAMLMPNSATQNGNASLSSLFAPVSHLVTYRVSGSTSAASLTYENPQGGTTQAKVSLPWQVDLTFKDGDYTYISAQNKADSGSVTTEILIDGTPWKKTSSNGGFTIADCNGSVACP